MRRLFCVLLLATGAISFVACERDAKHVMVQVWLTDAPGDYEEVNVEVAGVQVHSASGDQSSGWIDVPVQRRVYDLLKLSNGLDTLLGTVELPAGRISQIRLKLGDNNSIIVKGKKHTLKTPSGQQSGLKLQVHHVLTEGVVYKVLLDFDVARSVVENKNGYSLKPVIRTITEARSGAIKGLVDPVASTPAVYAIIGQDTVATTYADANGAFLLRGLDAGSYTVSFAPNSDFQAVTLGNVPVTVGNVTDLEVIHISLN